LCINVALARSPLWYGIYQTDGVDGYAFDEQRLKFNRTGVPSFS
jgi:hypothetical protein